MTEKESTIYDEAMAINDLTIKIIHREVKDTVDYLLIASRIEAHLKTFKQVLESHMAKETEERTVFGMKFDDYIESEAWKNQGSKNA